jgi:hypothetical protein
MFVKNTYDQHGCSGCHVFAATGGVPGSTGRGSIKKEEAVPRSGLPAVISR